MRLTEKYFTMVQQQGKKFLVECDGKRIDEDCAVIRASFLSNKTYNVILINCGIKVTSDFKTISNAIAAYKGMDKSLFETDDSKKKIKNATDVFNKLYQANEIYKVIKDESGCIVYKRMV